MSIRRLERAALATPYALKAVTQLVFNVRPTCTTFSDFQTQFLPILRFHNPKLQLELRKTEDAASALQVKFSDNTEDAVPFDKVAQSHHLMEILLNVDALKHSMKDKYVSFNLTP
jgi:hypothetical protein